MLLDHQASSLAQISSFTALPILAPLNRLLPVGFQALEKAVSSAPKMTLHHSGHACLVEIDVNLLEIMQAENFCLTITTVTLKQLKR